MSNELIVLNNDTALQVLSDTNSVNKLIDDVRIKVMSLEGGKMDTATGRKQIRSNAFKATKSKSKVKSLVSELIAVQELKMKPFQDVVTALKANYSEFAAGMDQIRKDTNAEVDAFEAEIKRIADEKALVEYLELWDAAIEEDATFNAHKKLIDHMQAIIDNAEFDKVKAEKIEAQRVHEQKIADEAAANAKKEAEQKAQAEKDRLELEKLQAIEAQKKAEQEAEDQRQAAIQADLEAQEARERARIDAEKAEALRTKQAKEAEESRLAQEKEAARLAKEAEIEAKKQAELAAENARKQEEKRQEDARQLEVEQANTRKRNQEHATKIKTEIKEQLMSAGLSEEDAIIAVKALVKPSFKHVTITY